jgi:hypothetical protein
MREGRRDRATFVRTRRICSIRHLAVFLILILESDLLAVADPRRSFLQLPIWNLQLLAEDVEFRRQVAETVDTGFVVPKSVKPLVPMRPRKSKHCTGIKGWRAISRISPLARQWYRFTMPNAKRTAERIRGGAKLRKSTPVFLVGNIGTTMSWYQDIGFEAQYFPPSFCILRRDGVAIFLQVHDGYIRPDDLGARERGAWSAYLETDDVNALFDEFSKRPSVKITSTPCPQPYGQIEIRSHRPERVRVGFFAADEVKN